MNSLVKALIQPILEAEGQKIALVPGGFKPPTMGHFYLVDEVSKNSNIDKVIVLIGHKDRDGVSKEESKAIWDIYKKYLPSNVEIQIADNSSPIADVASIVKNNPQNTYYPVVGIRGEMDLGDLKRFDSLKGKYDNFQTIVIKSESEDRISGTNTRAALIGGEKERFQTYLPTELSGEEKDKVWNILQKTPIKEFVTQSELDGVEKIADEWFEDYGIDVQFTKHFIERVNDERNGKPISAEELEDLFTQTAEKYGEKLANLPDDYQAVLLKLRNDINLPFALNYDEKNDEMDLVAKTVMRKKNFQTSNPKLALQEMYAEPSEHDYPKLIKSLTEYMLDKGMNIRPLPKVKFINDDIENARDFFGKTAYYDPNNRVVVLYTMDRHPKDVMRSFAHEMIHHMQNCDNRLGGITTQNTNEEGDLPEIEREAYEKGNMTFRNWTDTLTEGVLGDRIKCDNCGWSWPIKDGGDDLYICHKCGHDNTPMPLNEGRYDKITNTISSKIFNQWREDINNGAKASRLQQYFPFEDEEISIDANISVTPGTGTLKVDGGADDTEDYIEVRFEIDPEKLPEFWEEISMNLKDVIRHEIEHLTHGEGFTSKPSKYMEDDILIRKIIDAKLLPPAQYFKLEKEVDANLQGMYLRAKKEKRSFRDVIDTYLDAQDITPEEKEEILDLWRSRLPALNLPKF
jgi:phosphopantetheine adenylyltransferase